ncbi:hypothetical protein [Streptomyces caniscabiei]|jgi:hypothetical protein|uniref:Lipoprotein n=1 Tax=Streptomyces caniscabiei TaxID=2746961 RepID=A0A927QLL3_9ACTN|nr:hypothetical protein [Streptomyces caniscabiei]MBD9700887.1 hypothetical protein [Streptomyces caniscabiei]MBD9724949.1 hypothetical protein [Streptomyces caniscabiei]MDX3510480.1 hypothetical protein [Streptomyces caniscabiei]MDX3720563.1 hypothetical protein [Streptomyces caniscabiei]MDX3727566.1 hypothetical protein [Streptomyces caniscabiei]
MTFQPRGGAARRHSRRAAATLGAVSAGLLVLSACDEPTPMATVTIGTDSISSEAACYRTLTAEQAVECAQEKPSKSVELPDDETLRIGVDPEVADAGWTLWIDGRPVVNETFDKTYKAFPNPGLFATQPGQAAPKSLTISVVQQNAEGSKIEGVWNFKLENPDA